MSDLPRAQGYDKAVCTFHVQQYLGLGGLLLNTPFINLETTGRLPNSVEPTGSWVRDIADL